MYADGDYDLAGFAVGAVERDRLVTGETVRPGDIVIGLASSGVHSNGYSLVRRVVEKSGCRYADAAPFETGVTLGEALLRPTRLYVAAALAACRADTVKALPGIVKQRSAALVRRRRGRIGGALDLEPGPPSPTPAPVRRLTARPRRHATGR